MRIGVLGGSFDPIHLAHIGVARAAADALDLDQVWLMPAAQAPLRAARPRATGVQRAAMVCLAIEEAGDPRLELCEIELKRGGVSYTADTLRLLQAEFPAARFIWILGEDQFARLGTWREPAALAELADWAVYGRTGCRRVDVAPIAGLRWHRVEAEVEWPLSSTQVRARLACGESVAGMLPDKVIEYVRQNGLYR